MLKAKTPCRRILSEHELLCSDRADCYEHSALVSWCQNPDTGVWGYHASFKIGAEWINEGEALVVTPKRGVEDIDFLAMFMSCFSSGLDAEEYSRLYSIDLKSKPIPAPALSTVLSPLIIMHFLGMVERIKALPRDYVRVEENMRKVKGRISIADNEKRNILQKKYHRVYCVYHVYTEDTPANRLLKRALLLSKDIIQRVSAKNTIRAKAFHSIGKCLAKFSQVGDDISIFQIRQLKSHNLFGDYNEAVKLARIILRLSDYSLNRKAASIPEVIPFTLDMSLLYELYAYGLLREAYGRCIDYQYASRTGIPDFLFRSPSFRAILDTKYIPRFASQQIETPIVRQLSGYGRDLKILSRLGYEVLQKDKSMPNVPCIVVYPTENGLHFRRNPFLGTELYNLMTPEKGLLGFYKIALPIPMINHTPGSE